MKTFRFSPNFISAFWPGLLNSDIGILPSLFKSSSTITTSFSIAMTLPSTIDFSLLSFFLLHGYGHAYEHLLKFFQLLLLKFLSYLPYLVL